MCLGGGEGLGVYLYRIGGVATWGIEWEGLGYICIEWEGGGVGGIFV